jgi:hypothetical protein
MRLNRSEEFVIGGYTRGGQVGRGSARLRREDARRVHSGERGAVGGPAALPNWTAP